MPTIPSVNRSVDRQRRFQIALTEHFGLPLDQVTNIYTKQVEDGISTLVFEGVVTAPESEILAIWHATETEGERLRRIAQEWARDPFDGAHENPVVDLERLRDMLREVGS